MIVCKPVLICKRTFWRNCLQEYDLSLLQVIRKGEVSCCWICTACKENEYVQDEFTCKACDLGWWPNAELTGRKLCVSDCWPFQRAHCLKCEQSAPVLFDVHVQRALSNTPVKEHTQTSYRFPMTYTKREVYLHLNKNVLKGILVGEEVRGWRD